MGILNTYCTPTTNSLVFLLVLIISVALVNLFGVHFAYVSCLLFMLMVFWYTNTLEGQKGFRVYFRLMIEVIEFKCKKYAEMYRVITSNTCIVTYVRM